MRTFGIIAEGVTDQIVIEQILSGFFGSDDVDITYVQPPQRPSGGDVPAGGWTLVFKALEQGAHQQALVFNDYLVIHIDTDVSEQGGYDVPWRDGGRELSVEELVSRVVDKLKGLIGAQVYEKHQHRFIFAIAVHAIECWLLPLHYDDNRAGKIAGCLVAVNHALKLANKKVRLTAEEKDPRAYREASRDFTKRKRLLDVHDRNPSLALFIRRLEALASPPEAPSSPEHTT